MTIIKVGVNMETEKLKSIINQAQEAVKDITDESLKKIAFQKILDTLLIPTHTSSVPTPMKPQAPSTQSFTSPLSGSKPLLSESISEFVHSTNQKSHFNIVLAMAYHFHYKEVGDFNIEDIHSAYEKCLIPKPKNATDIINQNIRKSAITKVDRAKDDKQAYHITKQGIEYIDSGFTAKLKSSHMSKKSTGCQSNEKAKE